MRNRSPCSLLPAPCFSPAQQLDAFLATLLVLAILAQTLLGTLVRQMGMEPIVHISVGMLVAALAILVGAGCGGYTRTSPSLAAAAWP